MAGSEAAEVAIRALSSREDFEQAIRLQRAVWGFDEVEVLPLHLFVIAARIGGQVFGAFDGQRLAGFCISLPALKSGARSYLHSHMLGVLPEYRDRRIGRRLKLRQRDDALERGVDLIEWTFDPLEIRNAHFNIERLGVIVRRYVFNQYGTTSSPLHAGLPTDRLVCEWWLASDRVRAACSDAPVERPAIEASIRVPADIASLRREDPGQARRLQKTLSEEFVAAFQSGLAVVGFEHSGEQGAYLLGKWPFK